MRKRLMITFIIAVSLIILGQKSYGAVEIVPSKNGAGTDAIVNTTISNSYELCQAMSKAGGTLYGTTVLPHLATNKDWGAVSYLSNSVYGTNTEGQNKGIEIEIDSIKYNSTTGNITGVMNWGSNPNKTLYTQTAGIIKNYDNETSTAKAYVETLYNNKDSRFVEVIDTGNWVLNSTLGMAMYETQELYSSWSYHSTGTNYPISFRQGLFGFGMGHSIGNGNYLSGTAQSNITFRPVVWNK